VKEGRKEKAALSVRILPLSIRKWKPRGGREMGIGELKKRAPKQGKKGVWIRLKRSREGVWTGKKGA